VDTASGVRETPLSIDNLTCEPVVGAALHDIGHFTSEFDTFTMDDTGHRHHEGASTAVLVRNFPLVGTQCCR
jgi:predicted HD phosphohydrolase